VRNLRLVFLFGWVVLLLLILGWQIWPLHIPAQILPKTINARLREMKNLKVNAFGYGYGIVDIVCVFYLTKI
jgi:hypothetical protein